MTTVQTRIDLAQAVGPIRASWVERQLADSSTGDGSPHPTPAPPDLPASVVASAARRSQYIYVPHNDGDCMHPEDV